MKKAEDNVMKRILFGIGLYFLCCLVIYKPCCALENTNHYSVDVKTIDDLYMGLSKQIYNHQGLVTYNIESYDIFYRLKDILRDYDYYYCTSDPILSGTYLIHYVEEFNYTTIDHRRMDGSYYEVEIDLDYCYSREEMTGYFSEMEKIADDLKKDSDYKSVKAAHDYIIQNVDYDYNYKNYLDIEGFSQGEMVCNGYSMAMFLLLTDMDIPVRMISGTAIDKSGNSVGHAWNLVKIDGGWYAVDATWDDYGKLGCGYLYFLKGKNEFDNHICDEQINAEYESTIAKESYKLPVMDSFLFGIKNHVTLKSITGAAVFIICIIVGIFYKKNKYDRYE